MQWGGSPCIWFRRGPWGIAVAPPISPYTGPGWSPTICRVTLELRSVFPIFLCDIPHVYIVIILSVSLTPACPCLVFTMGAVPWILDLTGDWVDSLPLLALPGLLSFALTYSHDSRILMHPAIDIVWRVPVSFAYGCYDPLQLRCAWWSFVLVGSLPYPSPGRKFEPSCIGRLLCLRLG